eukprot:CAMPEP_0169474400 /NCGR_PEP_ID=MMETSP1042-20121227/26240_1 /TAXON_ID=464988 /ORGANISM="Hemiselmis andersenii, Strain CCMP1180" /LENGTH=76 /DNA_ID=CAMNT_0009588435 /DNA_START=238 /DNA_END=468 /DNA_ORIENTATION=-
MAQTLLAGSAKDSCSVLYSLSTPPRASKPESTLVLQWPDASSNGYAFFHRVDKVNGGDANPTHTTGFGRAGAFWYK